MVGSVYMRGLGLVNVEHLSYEWITKRVCESYVEDGKWCEGRKGAPNRGRIET